MKDSRSNPDVPITSWPFEKDMNLMIVVMQDRPGLKAGMIMIGKSDQDGQISVAINGLHGDPNSIRQWTSDFASGRIGQPFMITVSRIPASALQRLQSNESILDPL